ncbi:single-strand selective monofunctional uracil DNA glycosylase-like isoform X1 [Thrips palmi]|uniref:Single-strand selective monofunctional uracil DNA glycosylase-like isoform X1 n=1 Tax=Thrips palmi TaxID=161013 RepID=A0A6P8ZQ58_THRPL|nr:single-strand selective monofunctional uracil DNA glycosylase-like isoform X1 [Thrips palmi]
MHSSLVCSSLLNSLLFKMMKLESVDNEVEAIQDGQSFQSDDIDQPSTNTTFVTNLSPSIAEELLRIELELCAQISSLMFSLPVRYVYSPIEYAFDLHAQFVRNFCNTSKKVLFLGMNPGPWGMSQTGVPFGEVSVVKDWFGLQGSVKKPKHEHPSRLIQGLDCRRSEVSGKRFWGLFREICGSNPYLFFKNCFIYNQCPIALMSDTGKNITPAELKASESKVLLAFCDKALTKVIQLLKVHLVVGIGKFAEKRACIALNEACLKEVKVVSIPHPSPRNAHCSGNWKEVVAKILTDLGILDLLSGN